MSASASEAAGALPRIAIIGAGRMGSALARGLLKQGFTTIVWNRTSSRLAALEALGAKPARSPADAVREAEIVIVNVSDYAVASKVLHDTEVVEALRGKVLVQLTSGSPKQARETGAWAQANGIRYLDGAIMATPDLIGTAECTILYSGERSLFERHVPVFRALGGNPVHVGEDAGHASALDSAILVVMWGSFFAALQGVAICRAHELGLREYASYLAPFLQPLSGWTLDVVQRVAEQREAGDAATVASVGVHHTAFQCLMDLCRETGLDRALPDAMAPAFQAALAAGHSEDDFAVLNRFFPSALSTHE